MNKDMFKLLEIPINTIIVSDRSRNDLGDITELKDSIETSGLLNAILIDESYNLIAGERRLTACKELKHTTIIARIMPAITKGDALVIELMENATRKDFNWHEDLAMRYKIHNYWKEKAIESGKPWGFRETAAKFKCALGGISSDFTLYEAIKVFPELTEYQTKAKAREAYKKIGDQATAINAMNNLDPDAKDKLTHLMNFGKVSDLSTNAPRANHIDVMPNGDDFINDGSSNEQPLDDGLLEVDDINFEIPKAIFAVKDLNEFIPEIPDNTVGFCELDPPYAIDFNINYGKVSKISSFKDANDWTIEQLTAFYSDMLPILYQKLLPNSFIFCWTGKEHWQMANRYADLAGFKTQDPGIWVKTGGSCNTPKTNMISSYEMFVLFRKENATFNTNSFNSVMHFDTTPSTQRVHQWEKPLDMYKHLMKVFGKKKSIFLSPFAGSGKSMLAAAMYDMIPCGCDKVERYAFAFYQDLNKYFTTYGASKEGENTDE